MHKRTPWSPLYYKISWLNDEKSVLETQEHKQVAKDSAYTVCDEGRQPIWPAEAY